MGRLHDTLDDNLIDWIARQHLFFVATAPSEGGHVNLSPKGYDTFRVFDRSSVGYLDLTGSGVETIAHLRDNGRMTIMFCAFGGPPRILRLYGLGDVIEPIHDEFSRLAAHFPPTPGARAVIRLRLERISTSCGYAVPQMTFADDRDTLVEWAERKGSAGLAEYHEEKNVLSIDGLPGLAGSAGQRTAPSPS